MLVEPGGTSYNDDSVAEGTSSLVLANVPREPGVRRPFCCNYLQEGLQFSVLSAGLTFLPMGIGFFLASATAVKLVPKLGRGVLTLGTSGMILGYVLLLVLIQQNTPVVESVPLMVVLRSEKVSHHHCGSYDESLEPMTHQGKTSASHHTLCYKHRKPLFPA